MFKIVKSQHGQTLIEYALVLSFFITVFMVSIPPLRVAAVGVFDRITEQLTLDLTDDWLPGGGGGDTGDGSGGGDNGGGSGGGGGSIPWFPIELSYDDNNVIYSANNITLTGSSRIYGNVLTNGTVITSGTSTVFGESYENVGHDFNFPMPVYPNISSDSLANKGAYTAGWWPAPVPITEDGYYSSLTAVNELKINTGSAGEIRTLVVDNFEMSGSGKITLEGEGKLILVVNDTFKFQNNVNFNTGGLPENVVIYYAGNSDMDFGQGHLVGSVYTQSSGVTFTGSTSLKGNLFVGGDSVAVASGNVNLSDALLYAPNSNLRVTGSSSIEGRIIASSIEALGNATITFKPVLLDEVFLWDIPS